MSEQNGNISSFSELANKLKITPTFPDLPVICIQGLGFVGAAMAAAVANARGKNGKPYYNVVGVDLDTDEGSRRINAVNEGKFPFVMVDEMLLSAFEESKRTGNLIATSNPSVFALAEIVVVDINLDIDPQANIPEVKWDGFKAGMRTLGSIMKSGSLIVVETTVPPGTCEKIVRPVLVTELEKRGLPVDSILLAHSYERVMPGKEYFNSIVNFWRVFSGHTKKAGDACEKFLENVINTDRFPLRRLQSTVASETAKVLENSYRATNIAFIEEWGRFAEAVGVDLFEVITAVRDRETHKNIRQPGFGVGGYCLPKDPLLSTVSCRDLFKLTDLDFSFSRQAVEINNAMPMVSLEKLKKSFGSLNGKKILLLGVSYRPDVGDTRYSPAETFVKSAMQSGAEVVCYDPLVKHWAEMDIDISYEMPRPDGFDAVVFTLGHDEFLHFDINRWLNGNTLLVLDSNNVLTKERREIFRASGCNLESIGRGEGL